MNRRHRILVTAAVVAAFAAAGCSGPLVKATGRLTFKGQPVPNTYVVFQPDEPGKRPSRGLTDDDGRFTLVFSKSEVGVLRGHHTVFLEYHVSAAEQSGDSPSKLSNELKAVVAQYGDPKKSPLHYEITSNGQSIDIALP
jgi:hypothetical protein